MQKKRWLKMVSGVAALLLVLAAVAWVVAPDQTTSAQAGRALNVASASQGMAHSGAADTKTAIDNKVIVIQPDKFDVSPALRDIPAIAPERTEETLIRWNETALKTWEDSSSGVDVGLQTTAGVEAMPAPTVNFEGISNVDGVLPPDTQGDVGPNHYVQWVNLSYGVWDKSGNQLSGPTAGNTLWTGFDSICANNNDGDPITVYDYLADRWMMSQFQVNASGSSYQCIAVSTTGDPMGSWNRYRYTWPGSLMNDYPHFGLWPDAYYMTANQFIYSSGAWQGAGVAAYERDKMLIGAAAQMVYFNLYTVNAEYGGQLPADMDGTTQPASGAPGLIMEWDNSGLLGPDDALRVWKFHVDWTTPANSYLGTGAAGTAGGPNWTINTNDVDPTICGSSACIDQPGTTQNLDQISDRLMHRVQYRNFGGYQTLVGNHTVDTNNPAGIAGIHWFELRNTGTDWAMYQQGTYGPADNANRWMGSIAMDNAGNMALGYSVSSSSIYPSIRYAGRLSTDPLGTLPQAETQLIAGSGYQSHSAARWGDYSAMQVDPVDDCTFWYTQEYIQTSGSANWQTRVGAFKFDACGTPDFTLGVTPASQDVCVGSNAAYNVNVGSISGYSSPVTLSTSGNPGAAGFVPNPVTPPGSSAMTISGAAAGVYNFNVVGTAAGPNVHQTPVALTVQSAAPAAPVLTAPANGATNVAVMPTFTWNAASGAASYAIQVATDAGFTNIVASASGLTSPTWTSNVTLNTSSTYHWRVQAANACGASSYSGVFSFTTVAAPGDCGPGTIPNILFTDGFEAGIGGWTHSGTGDTWAIATANPHSGVQYVHANDPDAVSDQRLASPAVALPVGQNPVVLKFWHVPAMESFSTTCYDGGILEISTDGGSTWTQVPNASLLVGPYNGTISSSYGNPLAGKQGWCGGAAYINTIADVSAYAGQTAQFRMRLGSDSSFGATGWDVDDVTVQSCLAEGAPPNINVTPASLSSTQLPNTTTSQTLTIGNTGGADLTWTIAEEPAPGTCTALSDVPWLSEVPTNGTTTAGGTAPVAVTFNSTGLAPGAYNANLCVTSNDPDAGPGNGTNLVVVPVSLTVEEVPVEPNIDVSPLSLSSTQAPGTSTQQTLNVGNTGNSNLTWEIFEAPDALRLPTGVSRGIEKAEASRQVTIGDATLSHSTLTPGQVVTPERPDTPDSLVTITHSAISVDHIGQLGVVQRRRPAHRQQLPARVRPERLRH